MHWAYSTANRLMEQHPDRGTFVCASGISPSGAVHIGNFREIVTTYFVARALEKSGKRVRFIFSWDDFDRFRKVPAGIDPAFEQYIGMPYTEVPCPYGCHESYAEHFERQFEQALMPFGIRPEFIYQSREYRSKKYNPSIIHALRKRREIYDIVMAYKTGEASAEERERYYPVHVYCESCRKDATMVQSFDEPSSMLKYRCHCGHEAAVYMPEATNIKLQWKVDWPMRWGIEGVLFEPGGRDHSSETGSYQVSKTISEHIFGNEPPMYLPYEFIGIKGSHAKMSSSSGHNYTPDDLLDVYSPGLILFMFAKYQPGAGFHIGMDEDVIRNYSEYERYREAYDSGTLTGDVKEAMELSAGPGLRRKTPKFGHVSSILPLVDFDADLLKGILSHSGENYTTGELEPYVKRAEHWIKRWCPEKQLTVNENRNSVYYDALSPAERSWIEAFCRLLKRPELEGELLMEQIYAICHHEDKKVMKANQKRLFTIVYQLVLNQNVGPRIPWLIQAIGVNKLLELMEGNT